jgi:hypothetical protein
MGKTSEILSGLEASWEQDWVRNSRTGDWEPEVEPEAVKPEVVREPKPAPVRAPQGYFD